MKIEGRSVIIEGLSKLQGAQVQATDLRAAAALILAGLCADGLTEVTELHHLDRAYVGFAKKLNALGADIKRVKVKAAETKSDDNVIKLDFKCKNMAIEMP